MLSRCSFAEVDAHHLCWWVRAAAWCMAIKCSPTLTSSYPICWPQVRTELPLGTIVIKDPSHNPHSCINRSHLILLSTRERGWNLGGCALQVWPFETGWYFLVLLVQSLQRIRLSFSGGAKLRACRADRSNLRDWMSCFSTSASSYVHTSRVGLDRTFSLICSISGSPHIGNRTLRYRTIHALSLGL